ncbi:hypothetical protein HYH03_006668 [Edaphochlamys debaryana]|uniref:Uncharacterized protein n=1 Tax=Edaphochlamys debaryana TaxID=47281 RepID=A0A836C0M8_9CHLO|nr:hypothetical protein HYH03_006668 [Edaphochlamys debaryana]|eukprot:KAG2495057.1 hypothetical protein HYH03_006668 [Edaphochlamys debaryana]
MALEVLGDSLLLPEQLAEVWPELVEGVVLRFDASVGAQRVWTGTCTVQGLRVVAGAQELVERFYGWTLRSWTAHPEEGALRLALQPPAEHRRQPRAADELLQLQAAGGGGGDGGSRGGGSGVQQSQEQRLRELEGLLTQSLRRPGSTAAAAAAGAAAGLAAGAGEAIAAPGINGGGGGGGRSLSRALQSPPGRQHHQSQLLLAAAAAEDAAEEDGGVDGGGGYGVGSIDALRRRHQTAQQQQLSRLGSLAALARQLLPPNSVAAAFSQEQLRGGLGSLGLAWPQAPQSDGGDGREWAHGMDGRSRGGGGPASVSTSAGSKRGYAAAELAAAAVEAAARHRGTDGGAGEGDGHGWMEGSREARDAARLLQLQNAQLLLQRLQQQQRQQHLQDHLGRGAGLAGLGSSAKDEYPSGAGSAAAAAATVAGAASSASQHRELQRQQPQQRAAAAHHTAVRHSSVQTEQDLVLLQRGVRVKTESADAAAAGAAAGGATGLITEVLSRGVLELGAGGAGDNGGDGRGHGRSGGGGGGGGDGGNGSGSLLAAAAAVLLERRRQQRQHGGSAAAPPTPPAAGREADGGSTDLVAQLESFLRDRKGQRPEAPPTGAGAGSRSVEGSPHKPLITLHMRQQQQQLPRQDGLGPSYANDAREVEAQALRQQQLQQQDGGAMLRVLRLGHDRHAQAVAGDHGDPGRQQHPHPQQLRSSWTIAIGAGGGAWATAGGGSRPSGRAEEEEEYEPPAAHVIRLGRNGGGGGADWRQQQPEAGLVTARLAAAGGGQGIHLVQRPPLPVAVAPSSRGSRESPPEGSSPRHHQQQALASPAGGGGGGGGGGPRTLLRGTHSGGVLALDSSATAALHEDAQQLLAGGAAGASASSQLTPATARVLRLAAQEALGLSLRGGSGAAGAATDDADRLGRAQGQQERRGSAAGAATADGAGDGGEVVARTPARPLSSYLSAAEVVVLFSEEVAEALCSPPVAVQIVLQCFLDGAALGPPQSAQICRYNTSSPRYLTSIPSQEATSPPLPWKRLADTFLHYHRMRSGVLEMHASTRPPGHGDDTTLQLAPAVAAALPILSLALPPELRRLAEAGLPADLAGAEDDIGAAGEMAVDDEDPAVLAIGSRVPLPGPAADVAPRRGHAAQQQQPAGRGPSQRGGGGSGSRRGPGSGTSGSASPRPRAAAPAAAGAAGPAAAGGGGGGDPSSTVLVSCPPRSLSRYLTKSELEVLVGPEVYGCMCDGSKLSGVKVQFEVNGRRLPEVYVADIERYNPSSPFYLKASSGRGVDGLPWRSIPPNATVQWKRMADNTLVLAQISHTSKRGLEDRAAALAARRTSRRFERRSGGGVRRRPVSRDSSPSDSDEVTDSSLDASDYGGSSGNTDEEERAPRRRRGGFAGRGGAGRRGRKARAAVEPDEAEHGAAAEHEAPPNQTGAWASWGHGADGDGDGDGGPSAGGGASGDARRKPARARTAQDQQPGSERGLSSRGTDGVGASGGSRGSGRSDAARSEPAGANAAASEGREMPPSGSLDDGADEDAEAPAPRAGSSGAGRPLNASEDGPESPRAGSHGTRAAAGAGSEPSGGAEDGPPRRERPAALRPGRPASAGSGGPGGEEAAPRPAKRSREDDVTAGGPHKTPAGGGGGPRLSGGRPPHGFNAVPAGASPPPRRPHQHTSLDVHPSPQDTAPDRDPGAGRGLGPPPAPGAVDTSRVCVGGDFEPTEYLLIRAMPWLSVHLAQRWYPAALGRSSEDPFPVTVAFEIDGWLLPERYSAQLKSYPTNNGLFLPGLPLRRVRGLLRTGWRHLTDGTLVLQARTPHQ